MEDSRGFGLFGSDPDGPKRSKGLRWVFTWILLILLLGIVPLAINGWNEFYRSVGETTSPEITVIDPPPGIGAEPVTVKIKLSDTQSGLDEVIVRSKQSGEVREIVKKRYPTALNEDILSLRFNGRDSGFREGTLRLAILAFDRSFWSNRAQVTLDFTVDYEPPRIDVLSTQHNAARGGVELAFYTVDAQGENFSGAMVGSQLFPGFPAEQLDSDYRAMPNVRFAFFAIPLAFKEGSDSVQLLARDSIGNTQFASIFYRIRGLRQRVQDVSVPRSFLESRIDELAFDYEKTLAQRRGASLPEALHSATDFERIKHFRTVLSDYRELVEEGLHNLLNHPKAERFWKGKFGYPTTGRISSRFGSTKRYMFEGAEVGEYVEYGIVYATPVGTAVRAANDGVVVYADEMGLYGKTVVIDHGFGLSTLYTHLSSIEFLEGKRVVKGDVIAFSGSSGFALRPILGFEVRLHGVPVRPAEWWDEQWVNDHVEEKIQRIKSRLGIKIGKPLD